MASERRSIFHPLGMVAAWSIVGAVVVIMGLVQLFMLPQGSGFPIDQRFWRPLVPFAVIAAVAFGLSRLFARGGTWRDVLLSTAIMSGAGTIGFGLLLFTTAERPGLEDVIQARKAAPENTYTCTRKADGGMVCLNALGEPDPNYSYTIVTPETAQP